MGKITTRDFPIKSNRYYILDFTNLLKIKILDTYFFSSKAAEARVNKARKAIRKNLRVVKGTLVKELILDYRRRGKTIHTHKYDYPINAYSRKQRKVFRTQIRRRLRRLDLYTTAHPVHRVGAGYKEVKHLDKLQVIDEDRKKHVKVFQLDRKGPNYYYFIIDKVKSRAPGKLFNINTLQYDAARNSLKPKLIKLRATDIVTPMLCRELREIIKTNTDGKKRKKAYSDYRGWGLI